MRTISLHPASLAVGLVIGGGCLLSMGQLAASSGPMIEVIAHPRDMVQVTQASPFTVPAGKVLVITALGTDRGGGAADFVFLAVNGQQEAQTTARRNASATPSSMAFVPAGRTIPSGSTVTVTVSNPALSARAWGYLADSGAAPVGEGKTLRVPYCPHPRDFVQIDEGSPFSVPIGAVFVLTALGGANTDQPNGAADHALMINGQVETTALGPEGFVHPPLAEVPLGFTAPGGSTIEVVQTSGLSPSPGRAWGYLAKH